MSETITKYNFINKPQDAIGEEFDSDKYYLILLSKEDYEEILKSLVSLYKQRLRGRKAHVKVSDQTRLKSHEAKLIPILDNLTGEEAEVIIEKIVKELEEDN